mgnify:CR=1 FL=1
MNPITIVVPTVLPIPLINELNITINKAKNYMNIPDIQNYIKIIGSTLWSNINRNITKYINDYKKIWIESDRKMSCIDTLNLFNTNVSYILNELSRDPNIDVVLLTHHGSHPMCNGEYQNKINKFGVDVSSAYVSYIEKLYTFKNTISNIYLMLLNGGIDLLFRVVYISIVFSFCYQHKIFNWSLGFWYWFALLIAEDFLYYWLHRFDHEIRFFWATHVTHHSSEKMNFTVGFRSSVFQPLYRFIYFLPLPLLGFEPWDIVFIYAATQIWGIFVHTELIKKMG